MDIEELIGRVPCFGTLDAAERELVRRGASVRVFEAGAVIHGCGETCPGMIYILSGSLRALMISDEGREITLFRLGAGDTCVLSASCVLGQISFETQLLAVSHAELLIVDAGTFETLMEREISVRCFAYELATSRLSTVIWVMQQILFARFDKRLAGFLLEYSDRRGQDEIHMTQEEIAREVNSAREVVARMLKQFATDGLIDIRRGEIRLIDKDGLRKI